MGCDVGWLKGLFEGFVEGFSLGCLVVEMKDSSAVMKVDRTAEM